MLLRGVVISGLCVVGDRLLIQRVRLWVEVVMHGWILKDRLIVNYRLIERLNWRHNWIWIVWIWVVVVDWLTVDLLIGIIDNDHSWAVTLLLILNSGLILIVSVFPIPECNYANNYQYNYSDNRSGNLTSEIFRIGVGGWRVVIVVAAWGGGRTVAVYVAATVATVLIVAVVVVTHLIEVK